MVSQVERAMKGIPYQENSMCRGGVTGLPYLKKYRKLDTGILDFKGSHLKIEILATKKKSLVLEYQARRLASEGTI